MVECYQPHPYQRQAYEFIMAREASAVFLDMGLGKTVITLTVINDLLYDCCEPWKVLIIAPLRVAESTWTTEAAKWQHTRHMHVVPILGSAAQRERALQVEADIYTINWENVVWLVKRYGRNWPFQMVVLDESSGFKSHQAKRFRALKSVRPKIKKLVELTGTPAPNGLLDLWAQIYLLDGGERLGHTLTSYREKYFIPAARYGAQVWSWKLRRGADLQIYERIGDICMSMKASDYLTLPALIENVIPVKLDSVARAQYDKLERDWLLQVDDTTITSPTAAALASKLLQLSNGAIYDEDHNYIVIHDAKIAALKELRETTAGSLLVFYAFKHDLERLQAAFPDAAVYTGDREYQLWNAGEIGMMLVHPASIGYGLNLQAGGNTIVWYGLTWSLELYQQSIARLYRQGQKHAVIVHYLIAEGCYDELILPTLRNKELTQNSLLEAVKARKQELSS